MKQKILENLKNTYCRLKPSKIEGVGIFAIRDIPEGIDPFFGAQDQELIKFSREELRGLDEVILDMVDDFFIHEDGLINVPEFGLNGMDISFFLNNSNNPNIKTTDNGENFITIRKIKKGEELTSSYATYDDYDGNINKLTK